MTSIKIMLAGFTLGLAIAHGAQAGPIRQLEVPVPMRDGVALATSVWLPIEEGKYPLILLRSPYNSPGSPTNTSFTNYAKWFAEHGYAAALQDTRGRNRSPGVFQFLMGDGEDGYDAIEWLARASWSNGRVCTSGSSYLGVVQWLAAAQRPPHLVCMAPGSAPADFISEVPFQGGAFRESFAVTWFSIGNDKLKPLDDETRKAIFAHRPLATADEVIGQKIEPYREWLKHPTQDAYWDKITLTDKDFAHINIPILQTAGWFDDELDGTMQYWNGMTQGKYKSDQFLLVGPWTHQGAWVGGKLKLGDLTFSDDSIVDYKLLHLAFFDKYLKGTSSDFKQPRVSIYVTGSNKWVRGTALPATTAQRFYLSNSRSANSLAGDGRLLARVPGAKTDKFVFDPQKPVPSTMVSLPVPSDTVSFGGDRRPIQQRNDVLVYTSDKLNKPVTVIGPVKVELHASTDGKDTDFTAAIVDVQPDGRALLLGTKAVGVIRARYRTPRMEQLLTPGAVERYVIDLGYVSHTFMPGHQIRVDISSSASPMFNPNPNTGLPIATDTTWRIANQTIYMGDKTPSALVLPIANSALAN